MPDPIDQTGGYELEAQVGFLLRRANQRHLGLFAGHIPDLTATQFAALVKLCALGPISQNALGRETAMDAATIKGVIDRLRRRGLVASRPDPDDQRRIRLEATPAGQEVCGALIPDARAATRDTLAPLSPGEAGTFLRLLGKLV